MSKWSPALFPLCSCGNRVNIAAHDDCPHCGVALTTKRRKQPNLTVLDAMHTKQPVKRGSKYHYDGFIFDSKPEYERYTALYPLHKAGLIKHLCVHPLTELLPGVYPVHYPELQLEKPRKLSRFTYTPDFAYVFEGVLIVEDVKGTYRKTTKQHKQGDPIVTDAARIRHRILQMQRPHIIFDIVKDIEVSEFRWFNKTMKKAG